MDSQLSPYHDAELRRFVRWLPFEAAVCSAVAHACWRVRWSGVVHSYESFESVIRKPVTGIMQSGWSLMVRFPQCPLGFKRRNEAFPDRDPSFAPEIRAKLICYTPIRSRNGSSARGSVANTRLFSFRPVCLESGNARTELDLDPQGLGQ